MALFLLQQTATQGMNIVKNNLYVLQLSALIKVISCHSVLAIE